MIFGSPHLGHMRCCLEGENAGAEVGELLGVGGVPSMGLLVPAQAHLLDLDLERDNLVVHIDLDAGGVVCQINLQARDVVCEVRLDAADALLEAGDGGGVAMGLAAGDPEQIGVAGAGGGGELGEGAGWGWEGGCAEGADGDDGGERVRRGEAASERGGAAQEACHGGGGL